MSIISQESFRKPSYLALGTMVILLFGAILYYRERMIFIDAAGILFNTINTKALLIPENRFGSFITAGIPYLGTKFNLPLTSIVLAYSISFNLFYLIIISILIFQFKEFKLAILMACYYTLFVSDVYYWTNNEIHQGIAWLFLNMGSIFYLWKRKSNIWLQLFVFSILSALAISCHPLIIIAFGFLWVFYVIEGSLDIAPRRTQYLLTSILIIFILIKIFLSFHQSYDTNLLHQSTKNPFAFMRKDFRTSTIGIFLNYLLHRYWIALPILLSVIYTLITQRKYILLAFTIMSAFLFLILLSIVFTGYHYPTGNLFYLEAEWQLLAIIFCAPFIYVVLPNVSNNLRMIVLLVIFVSRLIYIQISYPTFHQRVQKTEMILNAMRKKNVYKLMLIQESKSITDNSIINLGLEHESFLLSKLDGDDPQRIVVNGDSKTIPYLAWAGNSNLITYFGPVIYPLNSNYFRIDTNTLYSILDEKQLFSSNK